MYKADAALVLTVSLAGLVDPCEVLVAAAFVGAFGVVADVGTHSELQALILICKMDRQCLISKKKYVITQLLAFKA